MTSSTLPTRSYFRIKYQYIVWLTGFWKRKKEKPELCQSFLYRCLHNKIFTEFFDYVQFSLFFLPPHTLKFNLLKVDFCLNTFGNQSLCKPRSQAVLYTSRCFFNFIFLTILHRERRSLLYCFTPAGRLCIQFTWTKTHVQVLQSGIFSLPGATVHWIHDQNRGSFLCVTSIGPERLQAPVRKYLERFEMKLVS